MRGCECYVWHVTVVGFRMNQNYACWAGVRDCYTQKKQICSTNARGGIEFLKPVNEKEFKEIYIADFRDAETKMHIENLLSVINEITPCELVKIKNIEYIKFVLLDTYDRSLILLNFIRNLWHSPFADYSVFFFEELAKSKHKDPIKKLTSANKIACSKFTNCLYSSPGHSNIHKCLAIRTLKEFEEYKIASTQGFLVEYK